MRYGKVKNKLGIIGFFLIIGILQGGLGEKDPFHFEYDYPTTLLHPGQTFPVQFRFFIPDNYFLYRDKVKADLLFPPSFSVSGKKYSPGKMRQDKFFKKILDVYEEEASMELQIKSPEFVAEQITLKLLLTYQGCSENLCYPAQKHEIQIPLTFQATATGAVVIRSPPIGPSLAINFKEIGWWLALLLVFLGGVATSFTPCVLPGIPITPAFNGR